MIVVGLIRKEPLGEIPKRPASAFGGQVTFLVALTAFANGLVALTGIEAIANATPAFRKPRQKRAQGAEATLAFVLGFLLLGLSILIDKYHAAPTPGRTRGGQHRQAGAALRGRRLRRFHPVSGRHGPALAPGRRSRRAHADGTQRLRSRRGGVVARCLSRHTDATICRVRFSLAPRDQELISGHSGSTAPPEEPERAETAPP